MFRELALLAGGLSLAFMGATCTKTDPLYCDAESGCDPGFACNLDTNGCEEIGTEPCTTSGDCVGEVPYCVPGPDDSKVCADTCANLDDVCVEEHGTDLPYCIVDRCGACDPEREGIGGDEGTDDCDGTEPICEGGACRRCESHDECASAVCLDSGACAAEADVLYAIAGDPGGDCGKTSQCSLVAAVGMLDGAHRIIKLDISVDPNFEISDTLDLSKPVTIFGDGATIDIVNNDDAPVVTVSDTVNIHGATITGAAGNALARGIMCTSGELSLRRVVVSDNASTGVFADTCSLSIEASTISGNQGAGIDASASLSISASTISGNQGAGIDASASLSISASTISGNQGAGIDASASLSISASTISGNQGGGISVSAAGATHTIINNFIYSNGNSNSNYGGIHLEGTTGTVFAHNTIVENTSDNDFGDVAGAVCLINIDAVNNLIYSNFIGPQADGDCNFASSYVAPGAPNNPMGFIAPEADPPNYKLDGSSDLVVDAGVASSIDIDFEGDPRPTGSAPDFGADEYVD